MMTHATKEFIYGLPKAELHLHLEGTLEPDLKLKLAQKNNIEIAAKTIEDVEATYKFNDLTSFLAVYYPGMEVLRTQEDFYDLAMAYFRKVKEHNVRYVEVFFDPQAHTARGVSFETLFEGYYKATQDAKELGIEAHLIMCFLRDLSEESAFEHYEMAQPFKDRILGIGLDSDERDNPPLKFQRVFKKAKDDGFKITMHCDIDQIGSIQNIRDALHVIGVDRIDHGTNIVEDPELVAYVIEKGIGLTSCPVSNGFVTDDMKGEELKALLHQGVKITVNSDDPAYFQSYVSDDLYAVAQKVSLTETDIVTLVKNAFEIAWTSDENKGKYLQEVDAYLAQQ
ncbi:adenosine deaminase [Erysipelothrix sp. HDW6B]|nr:adenosine deaminase [Erysipelothrix sp. HDW6B]